MRHVDSKARIAPPIHLCGRSTFVVVLLMFAFWLWHLQTYEIVALTLSGATAYVAIIAVRLAGGILLLLYVCRESEASQR
jgi:hypothetical protein